MTTEQLTETRRVQVIAKVRITPRGFAGHYYAVVLDGETAFCTGGKTWQDRLEANSFARGLARGVGGIAEEAP